MTLEELRARVGERDWEAFESVYDVASMLADDEFELDWIDTWVRGMNDMHCARALPRVLAMWTIDYIRRCDANIEVVLSATSFANQASPNFGDAFIAAVRQELHKEES